MRPFHAIMREIHASWQRASVGSAIVFQQFKRIPRIIDAPEVRARALLNYSRQREYENTVGSLGSCGEQFESAHTNSPGGALGWAGTLGPHLCPGRPVAVTASRLVQSAGKRRRKVP